MSKKGTLYLCPTPIGNLEDITLRALRTLKAVDIIAAEDTRVTIKLLNHFELKTPLISYHEHNRNTQGPKLVSLLEEGKNIAVVTDAGTPGLSDPGEDLVCDCIKAGIKVVPLPGAAAAVCALVASGLSTERFVFEGFLPKKAQDRRQRLSELTSDKRTLIFYEAPHRIRKTLKSIKEVLGNRQIVIAREMTKIHEEFIRGTAKQVIDKFSNTSPRGEMVIIVDGAKNDTSKVKVAEKFTTQELASKLETDMQKNMDKGLSRNKALKKSAQELGLSRNEAYELLIRES